MVQVAAATFPILGEMTRDGQVGTGATHGPFPRGFKVAIFFDMFLWVGLEKLDGLGWVLDWS